MDQFITLCVLSLAMFLGCYLAGSIPLVLSLSEKLLRNVTVFGAGLLIGTALIVIIPEGIESLYNSDLPIDSTIMPVFDQNNNMEQPDDIETVQQLNVIHETSNTIKAHRNPPLEDLELYLGLSLITGFVFMLIIDQLSPSHSHKEFDSESNGSGVTHNRQAGMTATIGLVVHAAADGLALGAAAGLSKTNVELIIFIAIMLHKAPAAFGFTSFLIHEGLAKHTAKYHLLAFSSAAPIASFIAYFGLVRIMYVVQLPLTGITMLFSAGTFLYVATVHVLNEVTQSSSNNSKLSKAEVIVIVAGALLPLLFNFVHHH